MVALLALTAFAAAVTGLTNPTVAAGSSGASQQAGSPYTMPVATLSSGGALFPNGSFAILGEPTVGITENAQYTLLVGTVAVLAHATAVPIPGDFDGDGDVDLDDFPFFVDCLAGPDTLPSPTPPTTPQKCLEVFDFFVDNDVDVEDFAGFQVSFTGP